MPFKPGESGNPNGNAGPKRFHAALERALTQDDGKRLRAAIEKLFDLAAKGEAWAIQMLADRLDGKAAQTVNVVRNERDLSDDDLANIAAESGEGIAGEKVRATPAPGIH